MSFDQQQRATLARLADILIPAGDQMPSASEAGVADRWLDAVMDARPDLVAPLRDLVERACHREAADVVAELRRDDPDAFAVLAEVSAGAYFMNPDVQKSIAYHGQGPQPIDPRPDYMDHGLLESVVRRGPIYRPTPKEARDDS